MATARAARSRVLSLILAVAAPAIALAPLVATGEPKPKPKPTAKQAKPADTSDRYDPDNVTAISQYMDMLAKGTERFLAKDHTTAIDTYKRAIQLSPRNPLGHLLLTEAYLVTGNLGEAEAAIQEGYEGDSKNATLRSHVLFVRADVFERQKKWDQAKLAWQAYTEHAAKLGPDGGAFPQSAAERLKAIQKMMDLDKAYVVVRERIAAEKADAGKKK
ncbi:MAG: tetratricopeptide repeat protein [Labilithrix sp.]|nr:tetratricopeptide repeat protein [Labilithrix sp.]MBX3222175.1 tetratricopeptide repeat protein [Labilithrix sp.]